jgi:hypothetical protein
VVIAVQCLIAAFETQRRLPREVFADSHLRRPAPRVLGGLVTATESNIGGHLVVQLT